MPTTEGGAPEEILKVCCFDEIALQRINYESGKLLGSPLTSPPPRVFGTGASQFGQELSVLNWGVVGERT
jgi:hypothetical protein